jgi:hypothetical protein
MSIPVKFASPWSLSLRLITLLGIVVLIGTSITGLVVGPREMLGWNLGMVVLPLLILVISVFFLIRGYDLYPDRIVIHRLGWISKLPLDGLQSVEFNDQAMKRSIRTFGNGGLFCFAGRFRNKQLGAYRAFATDASLAVVLKFSDRTVVLTPDRPKRFVEAINSQLES